MNQKLYLRIGLLCAASAIALPAPLFAVGQQESAAPEAPAAKAAPAIAPSSNAVPVAEIIVRINDQIISKADLDRAQGQMEEEAKGENWPPEQLAQREKELLSELIDQQLLLSKAKQLGITGDDELIRRLDEIRKQNNLASMEDLEKAAQTQGVSFEDFKANIRNGIVTQQVIREEVGKNIHLTSEQVQAYYKAHADQFSRPETIRLSEILVPAGDSDAEIAAGKKRADDIVAQLNGGAAFDELAKAVSIGPTAQQGGDLGDFKHGQLAQELEDATFGLKTGELTAPIRTRQGWIILKVTSHTPAGLQPFKDVEQQIEQAEFMDELQPALRAYLTKLREESFIDIAKGYTDVHASPNETKPIFSAYAPPAKKKRVKEEKYRFRSKTEMASDRAPAPAPAPKMDKSLASDPRRTSATQVPVGGPTAVATDAYANAETAQANAPAAPATADAQPAAATVKTAAPTGNGKRVKLRMGQASKQAQLPPTTSGPVAATDNGSTAASGDTAANAALEARLSPESQAILGNGPDAKKGPKTRYSHEPVVSKSEQKEEKKELRAAVAPPPAGPDEVAQRAVNSAPLGLNGNTAVKPKPVKADEEKTRYTEKKKSESSSQSSSQSGSGPASDQTSDASAQSADASAQPAAKTKRHKLLGII
jgi:peptidyl-prolyl cis-trans isomerase SurA